MRLKPPLWLTSITPALLGLTIGFSWHTGIPGVELFALLLPRLWLNATNRWLAAATWFGFYAALSTDVMPNYLTLWPEQSWLIPATIWLAHAALLSMPWLLLWKPERRVGADALRVLAGLLITTLPPLGFISWANPLLAAGTLFPGLGWAGMALTMALVALHARKQLSAWHIGVKLAIVGIMLIGVASNLAYTSPTPPSDWIGATTHTGRPPLADDKEGWKQQRSYLASGVKTLLDDGWSVIVLPESVAGDWFMTTTPFWQSTNKAVAEKQATLIMGATLPVSPTRYFNGVVIIDADGARGLGARIPMPVGLWRPWANWSAIPDWFGNGHAPIAGRLAAISVCFEDFMVFPFLLSMLPGEAGKTPDIVISMANNWFAKGRTSEFIQERSISLMARLYGKPLVRSIAY